MDGGLVDGLWALDTSAVTISGGDVGGFSVQAFGSAFVHVSGGTVRNTLFALESSSVTITGGSLSDVRMLNDSVLNLSGGTVLGNVLVFDSASVTMTGGHVVFALQVGSGTLSGGTVGGFINAWGTLEIVGTGFEVDGNPVPFGVLAAETGLLTGTLASGDLLNNQFFRGFGSVGTILLVPPPNEPPDCESAAAAPDEIIWPPNHSFHDVLVLGVTDPDGDPVNITITAIDQDEPPLGHGDGNTCPDGLGVSSGVASVRAERIGSGDGRAYHIGFTADDGQGGECSGTVTVCVPHDQGQGDTCADSGPLFDSTVCESNRAAAASAAARNCGIGFELAFLLPPLMWLRARQRTLRWDRRGSR